MSNLLERNQLANLRAITLWDASNGFCQQQSELEIVQGSSLVRLGRRVSFERGLTLEVENPEDPCYEKGSSEDEVLR